jgi:hypothetical protein
VINRGGDSSLLLLSLAPIVRASAWALVAAYFNTLRGAVAVTREAKKEGRLKVRQRVAGKMEWVVALPRTALEVGDDQRSQCSQSDGEQQDPSRRPGYEREVFG